MPNNNPNGKGGMKEGETRNPGGMRKGAKVAANDFKDWAFDFWKTNRQQFEVAILADKYNKMNFLRMVAGFVPQDMKISGDKENPLVIRFDKDDEKL